MNNATEVMRERLSRIRQILENTKMNPGYQELDAIYNLTDIESKDN